MIVTPNTVGISVLAPTVNPQTEQVARENKVKAPVEPAVELARANAERQLSTDDKRRKRNAWDPAEHPEYEAEESEQFDEVENELDRLFSLLALNTYSVTQGKGYVMRFRLPKKILDAALQEGKMTLRRNIIKYHYGHSVVPHTPCDLIIVT